MVRPARPHSSSEEPGRPRENLSYSDELMQRYFSGPLASPPARLPRDEVPPHAGGEEPEPGE